MHQISELLYLSPGLIKTILSFSSRQPITKQTFRQYRLLGKGGFGEVRTVFNISNEDIKL